MLSFHLHFDSEKTSRKQIEDLQKLLKLNSTIKNKYGDNYLKFNSCYHFFTMRKEFMPDNFIKLANQLVTKITIQEHNTDISGNKVYFKLGETEISAELYQLMMIGKNINTMLRLYKYFVDNKGNVAACKKAYSEEGRLRQEIKKITGINYDLIQENKRVKSLETENEVLKLKRKFYEDKFNELKGLIKNSFWSFLFPKPKELTLSEASFEWPKEVTLPHNVAK